MKLEYATYRYLNVVNYYRYSESKSIVYFRNSARTKVININRHIFGITLIRYDRV